MRVMRVLIACEFSAIVRDAFRAKGHDAFSCDILETEGNPAYHMQRDVREILDYGWDLMIAHPPCTYLANSGVRWLKDNPERQEKMKTASAFFELLLDYGRIPMKCIENPIQHRHCALPKPDQTVQPWMFGDNQTKAVCLWLKNLPLLKPQITEKPEKLEARVWRMAPGPNRQKERSRFFKGIASAMAEQWGEL